MQYGIPRKSDTEEDKSGVSVVQPNDIDSEGQILPSNHRRVRLDRNDRRKYALKVGDILFNSADRKDLIGKTALWTDQIEAVPAYSLIRIRIDLEKALPEFVWGYMNTRFMKQLMVNATRQAGRMAKIDTKHIRSLPAIVPELHRQRAFVSQMAKVEESVAMLAKARRVQQRVFRILLYRAFTGELTSKWRDSRTDNLLHEAQIQAEALGIASHETLSGFRNTPPQKTHRMLTALRLGNFKAFGQTQRMPLRPLTLVFGPNSAGKSSLHP